MNKSNVANEAVRLMDPAISMSKHCHFSQLSILCPFSKCIFFLKRFSFYSDVLKIGGFNFSRSSTFMKWYLSQRTAEKLWKPNEVHTSLYIPTECFVCINNNDVINLQITAQNGFLELRIKHALSSDLNMTYAVLKNLTCFTFCKQNRLYSFYIMFPTSSTLFTVLTLKLYIFLPLFNFQVNLGQNLV